MGSIFLNCVSEFHFAGIKWIKCFLQLQEQGIKHHQEPQISCAFTFCHSGKLWKRDPMQSRINDSMLVPVWVCHVRISFTSWCTCQGILLLNSKVHPHNLLVGCFQLCLGLKWLNCSLTSQSKLKAKADLPPNLPRSLCINTGVTQE